MTKILATCTLEGSSGLTDDSAINTFAFDDATLSPVTTATGAASAIEQFFNDATGSSGIALAAYLSPAISRAANSAIVRCYDITAHLDGSPYGSPIYEAAFTPADVFGASKALPAEVGAVLTLRGVNWETQPVEEPDGSDTGTAVDRPRSRRTGRLFVGPLTVNAQEEEAVTLRSRPSVNFKNTILDAAEALVADLPATTDWCVWSRKDEALYRLTEVSFDNAWDTMRSRGNAPTARFTQAL